MATYAVKTSGDLDALAERLKHGVLIRSISSSFEGGTEFRSGNARCLMYVFERYSALGGNRVSLSVTFFQGDDSMIHIAASATGGGSGIYKIVPWGENSFLSTLRDTLDEIQKEGEYVFIEEPDAAVS
jgi:hypothetical protein